MSRHLESSSRYASQSESLAERKDMRASGRFVLINPEPGEYGGFGQYSQTWPHLGMNAVGTAAGESGMEVVLWDENVQGKCDLESLVRSGDIVGLSLVVTGIERGVELAKQAKRLGAKFVIAGNDAAAFRTNQILKIQGKLIDAIFMGNSLDAVREFMRMVLAEQRLATNSRIHGVATEPASNTPSNVSAQLSVELKARRAARNAGYFNNDDVFIVPNLSLYPQDYWDKIWSNYRGSYGHRFSNPENVRNATIHLAQGCTRTPGGSGNHSEVGPTACTYCTINGVADIRIPSRKMMENILQAYTDKGINTFYNVTDSAFEMKNLVKLLEECGAKFDALSIYGRTQGIASMPEMLDRWLKMVSSGYLVINSGFDNAGDEILKSGINKSGQEVTMGRLNRQAVEVLGKAGAYLHFSVIFGAPGESKGSCEKTLELVNFARHRLGGHVDRCDADIFWLNHGSPASEVFYSYDYACRLASLAGREITREQWNTHFGQFRDSLSVPWETQKGWYEFFTNMDIDTAQEYVEKVNALMAEQADSVPGRQFAFRQPPSRA